MEREKLERELRSRVGRFVGTECKRRYPELYGALAALRDEKYPAYLCGGAVREFLLGAGAGPRDLDIIIGYASLDRLAALFAGSITGRTSLGGLKLQIKDWSVDFWRLQDTWAFREGKVAGAGFSDYPKTTFLNIDAIAIELFATRKRKRNIYSRGFFEAIAERVIELGFEDNPDPATCIVRALQTARTYRFAIGPRLACFMTAYMRNFDVEELAAIYQRRYGKAAITVDKLDSCMKNIEARLRLCRSAPVKVLPEIEERAVLNDDTLFVMTS